MIKIFKHLKRKELIYVLICVTLMILQVYLDLKLPDYMSKITLLVQTEGSKINDILTSGIFMLLCAIGSMITAVIAGYCAAKVAAGLSQRIRRILFNKVLSFSMEEINSFSTASLITRSTNDITQIQRFVAIGLQVIVKAPILAIWAIKKISYKSFEWTTATGIAVLFLLTIISIIIVCTVPKSKKIQTLTDDLNRVVRESLIGIRVVRAYNAEHYQNERFNNVNDDVTSANLFVNRITALMSPTMILIMSGLPLSIYWIGAILINSADKTEKMIIFSNMVVFSAYAIQVIMAFILLTIIFSILPRVSVSVKRVNEIIETKANITDGNITNNNQSLHGEIEFKNVSFKYPDASEYVLYDISFTAHKGETVAFIGSTGCGKSTLINLLPRFYDVTNGEVLVDGINVKDYTQNILHSKLGYVSQKAIMFSGTIKSNIIYGSGNFTTQKMKNAVNIAQCSDFIDIMSNNYDDSVSQGGINLSGGQKQRLSIARAIYKNPEIYIFDDSFSALDYKTDRLVRNELKEKIADATKIIVAQRIGTIKDADKIIVLDNGKIVGMGKHNQLLNTCEVYKEIALSQLSKEELANA